MALGSSASHFPTVRLAHAGLASTLGVLACLGCSNAGAQGELEELPSVTPYRPSVATPAALSAPGWLEIEAGLQFERGADDAHRDSLPYTLKLAFTPDWGVRLGGEAWVRQADDNSPQVVGFGDTSIVLKRRFAVNDASAFGLEAGVTLPTGHRGISSGKSDYSLNSIYSADIGSYHTDLNLEATRVGAVDPGVSRAQTLWAASLSKALSDRWGLTGEFSGTNQHGVEATSQFLFAASYGVSKRLVLDAGLARSIRPGAPDRSVFMGLTALGPRLF
jgi:hypothetical protein